MDFDFNFAKSLINNLSFQLGIVLDPKEHDYKRIESILEIGNFPETDETLRVLCHLIEMKRDNRRQAGFIPRGWTPAHDKLYKAISEITILTQLTHPGQRGGSCCGGRI